MEKVGNVRGEAWKSRDFSIEEFLGRLDRDLNSEVKRLETDIDGDFRLLAMQNLKTVASWVVTASYKYDYATDLSVESLRICKGLLVRVERELGLKVLGSQSSPPGKMGSNNGSGFAEENRYLAKMQKATQTQVTTCVDASVGVFPVDFVDVGVQVSCGPRPRRKRGRGRGAARKRARLRPLPSLLRFAGPVAGT